MGTGKETNLGKFHSDGFEGKTEASKSKILQGSCIHCVEFLVRHQWPPEGRPTIRPFQGLRCEMSKPRSSLQLQCFRLQEPGNYPEHDIPVLQGNGSILHPRGNDYVDVQLDDLHGNFRLPLPSQIPVSHANLHRSSHHVQCWNVHARFLHLPGVQKRSWNLHYY